MKFMFREMRSEEKKILFSKNRIENLCDGIFAITMTLIILELKTPENIPHNLVKEELPSYLLRLIPQAEAYAISFIILAIFWLRHLIHFKFLNNVNRQVLGINIVFLLFIGFIPFSVGIVMRYYGHLVPTIIYITNLLIISIILHFHWQYIYKEDELLNISEDDREYFSKFKFLSIIPIFIFIIALVIAFFNVRAAFYFIYLDPLFYFVYKRIHNYKYNHRKIPKQN